MPVAILLLAVFLIVGHQSLAASAQRATTTRSVATTQGLTAERFRVYDSLLYRAGKPRSERIGMLQAFVSGHGFWRRNLFGAEDQSAPSEAACRLLARKLDRGNVAHRIFVIDIEHWPVDPRRDPIPTVDESLEKLGQILDWMHDERPNLRIGLYGVMPVGDYYVPAAYLEWLEQRGRTIDDPGPPDDSPACREGMEWVKASDYVLKKLGPKVDFLCPSLYTFFDEPERWRRTAQAQMTVARRAGKPVYPFLWPRYHQNNEAKAYQRLPADMWGDELQFVGEHADGMVLWDWDGFDKPWRPWNPRAEWWLIASDFIRSKSLAQ